MRKNDDGGAPFRLLLLPPPLFFLFFISASTPSSALRPLRHSFASPTRSDAQAPARISIPERPEDAASAVLTGLPAATTTHTRWSNSAAERRALWALYESAGGPGGCLAMIAQTTGGRRMPLPMGVRHVP